MTFKMMQNDLKCYLKVKWRSCNQP